MSNEEDVVVLKNARRHTPRRYNRKTDALQLAGLTIAREGRVKCVSDGNYIVHARGSEETSFGVRWDGRRWRCDCTTNPVKYRICEHIHAVSSSKNPGDPNETQKERRCPRCESMSALHVRKGLRNNKYGIMQTYLCTVCGLRFVDRLGFEKMRSNPRAIMASLDLYFKGLSLTKVSSHLLSFYNVHVTPATVYNWIRKYISLIRRYTRHLHPEVSGKWHADETKIKIKTGKRQAYLWDVMDSETRFMIAKHLSLGRGSEEAEKLLTDAIARARKEPETLITDGLQSYGSAVDRKRCQGSLKSINHVSGIGLRDASNNRLERMQGTLKERTKTLRALGNVRSGRIFTDGLETYYNYVRPHSALNGSTPAERARIEVSGPNRWSSLIESASRRQREI